MTMTLTPNIFSKRYDSDDIQKAYFLWLCGLVGNNKDTLYQYNQFLWTLYTKDFEYTIQSDRNRAEDGKKLRDRFVAETASEELEVLNGPCSILEMLIALALHMDYQLSESVGIPDAEKWFWIMIRNLKLTVFKESDANLPKKMDFNVRHLDIMLDRKYDPDGQGGLFPLKKAKTDQRETEIWYQMMYWIAEHTHLIGA